MAQPGLAPGSWTPDGSTNRQVAAITARFAGHMVHLDGTQNVSIDGES